MPKIRQALEKREKKYLAPWAAFVMDSRGRKVEEEPDPYRTAFQRDRDRILHTKAFRRLKRKTQVFLAPTRDHYRTRLTHTLEVSQIARSIARALMLNEDLTEAIALGHDLGHTPFGHAGERVLNEIYPEGFEHAAQSLRVVDKLETTRHTPGMNLSWEVRDGIRWHSAGKCILRGIPPRHPATLEGQVLSIADAIAYISHDIDDALRAKIITLADLPKEAVVALGESTSERIDSMVVAVIEGSGDGEIGILPEIAEPMNQLRDYLYQEVYPSEPIDSEIRRAEYLLKELYWYLLEHPETGLITGDPAETIERRTVDFVAGMTDEYALQLHSKLMLPARWQG